MFVVPDDPVENGLCIRLTYICQPAICISVLADKLFEKSGILVNRLTRRKCWLVALSA